MKALWKLKPPSPIASELARTTGLSTVEAQILANRGLSNYETTIAFLSPKLANLNDPLTLEDMDNAIALVLEALECREIITVYGDFDADGLTATALLYNFFSSLGVPISYYIPDRLTEGYGLHPMALKKIAAKGPGLLITVDCGTSNQDTIALARAWGLKVLVTDHHQVPENFIPRCPVINPHRPGSTFAFKYLAGVGVAFYLIVALRAALRENGWFKRRSEPDLREYLDLVALGTVADMVPLLDQNRILVKSGLERIRQSRWPGIQALAELTDLHADAVSTDDLAYRMAPRLNASGRLGEAEIAVTALTTQHLAFARELAEKLELLNAERRLIEQKIMDEIERTILSDLNLKTKKTLVVAGKGWHRGVLGILASKLTDRYHRPALVLNIDNGIAAGSGRSIPGFNLYRALTTLAHLFERYGGHEHAAGLALKACKLESLASEFEDLAQKEIKEDDLHPSIEIDAKTSLPEINLQTTSRLLSFAPFGPGNPEPLFYAGPCEVVDSTVLKERHLKLKVRQNGKILEAIGFGMAGNLSASDTLINVVFTPKIDRWQGREKLQLRIIDMEPAGRTDERAC
ncbi:MAG: single-stranded-DNA-specific exonuclease RecJ [Deltaproteobacteria bacterium]|nr:single-stranded-DNA-specific exonuclease RecJ [Deltaproteobacteria bacterium]